MRLRPFFWLSNKQLAELSHALFLASPGSKLLKLVQRERDSR